MMGREEWLRLSNGLGKETNGPTTKKSQGGGEVTSGTLILICIVLLVKCNQKTLFFSGFAENKRMILLDTAMEWK